MRAILTAQHLPEEQQQKTRLFSRCVHIRSVNVGLENFALPNGIRVYLRDKATTLGLRGFVRRAVHDHVFIRFDGNLMQLKQYQEVLENLKFQTIFQSIETIPDIELINGHILKDFEICRNERRSCFKNPFSDGDEWGKKSSSDGSERDYIGGPY